MNPIRFVSRLTRKSRSNFFHAFLCPPRPQREALCTVYAFCRIVDDAVDVGQDRAAQRKELERRRAELAQVFEGSPEHPTAQRLPAAVKLFAEAAQGRGGAPTGRAISDEQLASFRLTPHPFHDDWNCIAHALRRRQLVHSLSYAPESPMAALEDLPDGRRPRKSWPMQRDRSRGPAQPHACSNLWTMRTDRP
jgi:squalene/phytoene synthase